MSSLTDLQSHHVASLHPAVAALAGATSFAVSLAAGDALGLSGDPQSSPPTTVTDVLAYTGLVLAGVVLAVWLGTRARAGAPDRLARYALGLAIGSAVTLAVFWTGWPHVLGAVAIALAVEHRRRIGGFTALSMSAATLGALTLTASIVLCLVG